jgi:hypothetical protein
LSKTIGAIIGLAGAQILTFVLFWLLSEPCQNVLGGSEQCLWGFTLPEYWARYGSAGSVFFTGLGYVLAEG